MSEPFETLIHATAVALDGDCVLLRGPSGSGKSDLALRMLALGPTAGLPFLANGAALRLVSDDQVHVRRSEGHLDASCPSTIAGKIEVRGIGIVEIPALISARVVLVVELSDAGDVPRLPDARSADLLGVVLPLLRLNAFEPSAPVKVALALAAASAGTLSAGHLSIR